MIRSQSMWELLSLHLMLPLYVQEVWQALTCRLTIHQGSWNIKVSTDLIIMTPRVKSRNSSLENQGESMKFPTDSVFKSKKTLLANRSKFEIELDPLILKIWTQVFQVLVHLDKTVSMGRTIQMIMHSWINLVSTNKGIRQQTSCLEMGNLTYLNMIQRKMKSSESIVHWWILLSSYQPLIANQYFLLTYSWQILRLSWSKKLAGSKWPMPKKRKENKQLTIKNTLKRQTFKSRRTSLKKISTTLML